MTEGQQTVLKDNMTFDEANEIDALSSKYFKPETNIQYELEFGVVSDGKPYRLCRKRMPKFGKKDEMEDKTILELNVVKVNGKKPETETGSMEWGILSSKLRSAFEPYCTNKNFMKKVYAFKQKGEGKNREYQVSEIRDIKEE